MQSLPIVANGVALRRLVLSDLPAFQAYRSDLDVGRYQGWSPMSDGEAAEFLTEMGACPLLVPGTWLQLAIADAHSHALLGDVGILVSTDSIQAEIGFTVSPTTQGRGVATAAVGAAIGWLFESTPVLRVVGITDARNYRCIRVLQRVGMRKLSSRDAVFRGQHCIEELYARGRNDAA